MTGPKSYSRLEGVSATLDILADNICRVNQTIPL